MQRFATVIESWAYAVWMGSLVGFAAFTAPTAFRTVSDVDTVAALNGKILDDLATLGYVCGPIAGVAALVRTRTAPVPALARVAIVAAMLGLVTYEQRAIVPAMLDAQRAMGGSFRTAPEDNPERLRYRELHQRSTRAYGGVVVLGFAALAIASLQKSRR